MLHNTKYTNPHLLALSDVSSGGDRGYQAKLGVVEDHELSVGSEAVVTLVGQTGAVVAGALGPVRDVNGSLGDISRVVYPGVSS